MTISQLDQSRTLRHNSLKIFCAIVGGKVKAKSVVRPWNAKSNPHELQNARFLLFGKSVLDARTLKS